MNLIEDGIFDCIKQILWYAFPLGCENEQQINKEVIELIKLLKELIHLEGED